MALDRLQADADAKLKETQSKAAADLAEAEATREKAEADKQFQLLKAELQRVKDADKVRLERGEENPKFVPSHVLRSVPNFTDTDLEGFFLNF